MSFNITTGAKAVPDVIAEDTTQTGPSPSIKLVDDTSSEKDFLIKLDANKVDFRDDAGGDGDLLTLDLTNTRVGIGTTSPQFKLSVVTEGADSPITTDAYTDAAAQSGVVLLRHARGTEASPSDLSSGDVIGRIIFQAHGLQFNNSAFIDAVAAENQSNANRGADLTFATILAGGGGQPVVRMTIQDDGNVGIGTANPDHKLHVETAGDPAIFKSTSGNGRIAIDAPSTKNSGVKLFEAGVLQWQLINQGTDDTFKIQNAGFSTKFFIQQDGDVGIGTTSPNSILSFKMGDGTGVADASGRANVNTTTVGNVGTGEDDLMTYSLPADSLNTDGKSIRITAWGTLTTSSSKTVRLKFGSTIIQQIGATTSGGIDWKIEGLVIRTGAATQKALGTQLLDTFAQDSTNTSPTETLSGVVVIKVTGEGVANDDIKQEGMLVEYLN